MPISPLAKRTIWVSVIAFSLSVGAGIGLRLLGQAERPVKAQTPQQNTPTDPTTAPTPNPLQLDDRLKAATRLASQSRYVEALEQLNEIAPNDPVAVQAQTLREVWSTQMLDRALVKYNEADLQGAIAIAEAIPTKTEAGREVQQELPTWRRQQLIIEDALTLIQSNPQEALARFKVLEDTSFAKSSRYQKWIEQTQAQIRWRHQRHPY
ncbi:hypothetical protein H6F87_25880 [Cyanobacteria bacterium FACHB-502]|nr:hypothetical protein [Cyanobacteria bacterium FACHB-502]